MAVELNNLEFGTRWTEFHTDYYEGYLPNMSDYHMHEYYEISLILSGNVKILLPHSVQTGTECRLVLTRPMTSHLIVCEPNQLYKRLNLLFAGDFLSDDLPMRNQLLGVFGKHGKVVLLSQEQAEDFLKLAEEAKSETDPFRQRLRLMIFLSKVAEISKKDERSAETLPSCVSEALSYIQESYQSKIVADELAWRLGVGRTTLMTSFKRYTGSTLNEYLTRYRLKQAIPLLRQGKTQQDAAEACGFGDACNLIRAFKRCFNVTPGQYLKTKNPQTI
jgi:AraC-like DNA-binding protein